MQKYELVFLTMDFLRNYEQGMRIGMSIERVKMLVGTMFRIHKNQEKLLGQMKKKIFTVKNGNSVNAWLR
jgi:hypothetical protein